jgi:hypothetical protein
MLYRTYQSSIASRGERGLGGWKIGTSKSFIAIRNLDIIIGVVSVDG